MRLHNDHIFVYKRMNFNIIKEMQLEIFRLI